MAPVLIEWGTLQDITKAVGWTGASDGGKGKQPCRTRKRVMMQDQQQVPHDGSCCDVGWAIDYVIPVTSARDGMPDSRGGAALAERVTGASDSDILGILMQPHAAWPA